MIEGIPVKHDLNLLRVLVSVADHPKMATAAQMLPEDLAKGNKSGYNFAITKCHDCARLIQMNCSCALRAAWCRRHVRCR